LTRFTGLICIFILMLPSSRGFSCSKQANKL